MTGRVTGWLDRVRGYFDQKPEPVTLGARSLVPAYQSRRCVDARHEAAGAKSDKAAGAKKEDR